MLKHGQDAVNEVNQIYQFEVQMNNSRKFHIEKSKDEINKDNYDYLKERIYKLKGLGYESEYPFFHNKELKFITITIEKTNFNTQFLESGVYYHLDYTMKIKDKDGKSYINCYITPDQIEECDGEVLEL